MKAKWEPVVWLDKDGNPKPAWFEIKTDWALLVIRPLDKQWDYRVQLDGPTKPHAIGGDELFDNAQEAMAACVRRAKQTLRRYIEELSDR